MKRRLAIEIIVGAVLILGFFYWLYIRPEPGAEKKTVSLDHPSVKKGLASGGKVLVIGVDGMTWDIAMDLIQEGRMPNLGRLVTLGGHGVFHSTPPLISPAIWTTMATGKPREEHGIDNFLAKVPFEYQESIMTSRYRNSPAIWTMADHMGKSAAVINWYSAQPAEELERGIFLAEGIDSVESVDEKDVYPPEWIERVRTAPLPRYLDYEAEIGRIGDDRIRRAYDQDRLVFSLTHEILRVKKPDLVMTYFQNVDVLSHGFWKYGFPVSLDHKFQVSQEERDRYRDVIETHYEFTDRLIGGLMAQADDYTVIVVSDHGFGPTYPPKNIYPDLNELLHRLGYLEFDKRDCDDMLLQMVDDGILTIPQFPEAKVFEVCQALTDETMKWLGNGHAMMSPPAVDAYLSVNLMVEPPSGEAAEAARRDTMTSLARALVPASNKKDIYWERTAAWNVSDFHKDIRGIYLNVKDREPQGVIPMDSYEKVRKEMVKALGGLRTEEGTKLFKTVEANPDKDLIPSEVHDPPDILVEVDKDALVHWLAFRGPGDKDPVPLAAVRWSYGDVSGDHEREGVFALAGKRAATFGRVDVTPLDIAPTVLWALGLPLGADMPGEAKRQAFNKDQAKREPVYIETWNGVVPAGLVGSPVELTPERRKLFGDLGYIQGGGDSRPPPSDASPGDTAE